VIVTIVTTYTNTNMAYIQHNSPFKKQKLSPEAAKAKAERDLKAAKTPYRRFAKADAQKKRRNSKTNRTGYDYDHRLNKWVKVSVNRGNGGKGTKSEGGKTSKKYGY